MPNKNNFIKYFIIFTIFCTLNACNETDNNPSLKSETPVLERFVVNDAAMNNKGVGQMGSFEYDKAVETFEALVNQNKNWDLAQQNLAIALLNRQKKGDEEKAINIAENLSKSDKKNLVAHYIVGILKFNQGLCEQALPRFEAIINADNTDAYALYFAAQCYLQNGEIDQALILYQKAIESDNYLRSAYYGAFMAAQRLSQSKLAKEMLNAYQKLDANPKAKLAEIKYTRMGPKASAQVVQSASKTQGNVIKKKMTGPYFEALQTISMHETENVESIGLVNLSQIDQTQLYLINDNKLDIYENIEDSARFLPQYSIELNPGPHKIAWGDINNDNKIDVYITGKDDQLYIQIDSNPKTPNTPKFEKVNMQAYGLSHLSSNAVRMADADHDGDLDILLLSEMGVFEIWNNNLNQSFRALSKEIALPRSTGFSNIYLQDIDSDRDVDIILQAENHVTTLLNDRMWSYEAVSLDDDKIKIRSLSFSDNNINGLPEMSVLYSGDYIQSYEFDRSQKKYITTNQISTTNADSMLQLDINGNAQKEFILVSNNGLRLLKSNGELLQKIQISGIKQVKVINTTNGPELLVLAKQLYHVAATSNRLSFVLLNFTGKQDDANSVRSNNAGIGTQVVLHNDSFYAIGNSFQNLTGIDQDYQPISLAAGQDNNIDFIAIDWSDGVYQTELDLTSNKLHLISETQRQLSSCPVIFAWSDGEYKFISDVLGVGGIGFALGLNQYGTARPWENYLLTSDQLNPDNGIFKLQFTEPMEESAYLDELKIKVIDIPGTWSIILDERMQVSEPIVTGEPLYYQSSIKPMKVTNSQNQDVTELALYTDKKAITINNKDHRFLGLVDEQIITIELMDEIEGDYQLIMNGWVEYGYSQTMFAAWQAGKSAQAPSLEYYFAGKWHLLLKEFGYPAGMPRAAAVPISLPEKTRLLRLRTNMEIYFDQLALVKIDHPPSIKQHELELHKATLKQLGFPRRQDNQQRVPEYNFADLKPFWDTRYMEGAYSQLGDITELLTSKDNALAIIAAGEAIELQFVDNLPQLVDGDKRYYILQFKGWAKDMDILTRHGETLAPIPSEGEVGVVATKLNQKYNTRFKGGK